MVVPLSHSHSPTMSTLSSSIPGMGTVSCLFGNIPSAVRPPFEPGTRRPTDRLIPVRSALCQVVMGGAFTALHVYQGARPTPQLAAVNIGFLYAYGALQCPMEALTGRHSWTHNAVAGGILGYVAYERGVLGIPFNLEHNFRARQVPLAAGAALVYGSMGAVMAMIAGKPL